MFIRLFWSETRSPCLCRSLGARMLATDADWMTPEMKEKMDLLHALPEWLESLARGCAR